MTTFWLSYDLGVGGDYPGLYQWLDDHQAVVCGNNMAKGRLHLGWALAMQCRKWLTHETWAFTRI